MAPDPRKCLFQVLFRCRDYQRKQFYIFIKEIADRFASLVALSLLSPLMLIVALLVLAPRSLFSQKRPATSVRLSVDQIPYYA